MSADPTVSNPDIYTTIFENERVRVLLCKDKPGDRTSAHHHPDSVVLALSSFKRRHGSGGENWELEMEPGEVRWVGAHEHYGENIGDTDTRVIFVELK